MNTEPPVRSLDERRELVARLRARKPYVAKAVTEDFLRIHPDFATKYGQRGFERGIEDAGHHLEYLCAAIEADSSQLLAGYLSWTERVLEARGIGGALSRENVEQVVDEAKKGLSDEAADLVDRVFRDALGSPPILLPHERREKRAALDGLRTSFTAAVLSGQRRIAVQLALDALTQGLEIETLYLEVFQQALYDVGAGWQANRLSVAEEHMATATVQYVVAQVYAQLPCAPAVHGVAVVTGVEGEHHQVGANLVADTWEHAGFAVRFLGANVPQLAALQTVEELSPALVGISTTMPFNLAKAIDLVQGIRARRPSAQIIVGGAAFADAPGLVRELGVLGPAPDLSAGLELALAATGSSPSG